MAYKRVIGWDMIVYLVLFSLIQGLFTKSENREHPTISIEENILSGNKVYSYGKLINYNGFKLIDPTSGRELITPNASATLSHIIKSPKYRLVTRILIIALLAAGDIETQPGPTIGPLHTKRKYEFKVTCTVCQKGVKARPVTCNYCGMPTHATCITNLTKALYDSIINNNEEIIYNCNFCINKRNNKVKNVRNASIDSDVNNYAYTNREYTQGRNKEATTCHV